MLLADAVGSLRQRIFLFMGGNDGVIDLREWMQTHRALGKTT